MNPFGFETFAVLLIVLAVAALWSTVKMVPQGYNYTVENFGRYTRTLNPGLHILVPVMERVGATARTISSTAKVSKPKGFMGFHPLLESHAFDLGTRLRQVQGEREITGKGQVDGR